MPGTYFSAMSTPEDFLRAHRLEPLEWDDVLRRVETRLTADEAARFARLHRAFVAYPAEHTCRGFYDFIARHELHALLACHRFHRLAALVRRLHADLPARKPGVPARALDQGAGSGILSTWLRDQAGCTVSATDLSAETRARLESAGFPPPRDGDRFDLILCADSLGEIHADEDDWLSDAENAGHEAFCDELEARYGLAHKLAGLKGLLAPGGIMLVYEPIASEHVWRGAARLLEAAGWRVDVTGAAPVFGLRLTLPA